MKKILFLLVATFLLSACTKEDEALVGTTWSLSYGGASVNLETGDTVSIGSYSFKIKFETANQGHAYLNTSETRYWGNDTITYAIYGVFDVSYSFNGENQEGTITFTKEHCEGVMYAEEYFDYLWNEPITSSFYTYDDSKMLIYSYPGEFSINSHLMTLTKE